MKTKEEIFNELVSPIVEFKSITSKKDLFVQNIEYVKNFYKVAYLLKTKLKTTIMKLKKFQDLVMKNIAKNF